MLNLYFIEQLLNGNIHGSETKTMLVKLTKLLCSKPRNQRQFNAFYEPP